jgi:hypothetical protein
LLLRVIFGLAGKNIDYRTKGKGCNRSAGILPAIFRAASVN